jgi:hypothetical protein
VAKGLRYRRSAKRRGGSTLSRRNVLVLYWNAKGADMRSSVRQHARVLDGSGARVLYHNAVDPVPPWVVWASPDLCILHTTFLCARWYGGFETYRRRFAWVGGLDCPKVALPQDEYDHAVVLEDWLLELGATSVYSCFGADQRSTLYPRLGDRVAFHETLTGFIDVRGATEVASRMAPHAERPLDVVYRATKLPYWFGSHGQLKHRIAEAVERVAGELGLRTDISTRWEDTIFGDAWLAFLMSGRAVIGCESGSSVLDRRGEIQKRITGLLAEQHDLTFEEVDKQMPAGWDSYAFFAISPRHLEAVVTKTAQVLVEGAYSGVLQPERHYIPVRRDLSDLAEALERVRDLEAMEAMTERAYREVYLEGHNTLEDFAAELGREPHRRGRTVGVPFAVARRIPVPRVPDAIARRSSLLPRGGRVVPLLLTLLDALFRDPGARRLLLRAAAGRVSLPLREVVQDIVLLRVLARSRGSWSISAENMAGTITIRTHPPGEERQRPALEGPFEHVAWNHAAVGQAAPLFPWRRGWGWVTVGTHGRHEFRSLGVGVRTTEAAARAVLEHALGLRESGRPLGSATDPRQTSKARPTDQ